VDVYATASRRNAAVRWLSRRAGDARARRHAAFFPLTGVTADSRVLDVGCGGLGLRALEPDLDITGVDVAARLDYPGPFVRADAAQALPFDDGAFDLVVAYNSPMDADDMPAAVREAARVLAPGGRLCACTTHPLPDSGSWRDEETFAITESYLERRWLAATMERDGLEFTFAGWCYPLESYARALEEAGLLIEALREPADPAGGRWARVPMFLMWRALKAR
jgi:SAM-dependent methyltransferase